MSGSLEIRDLRVSFSTQAGVARAVDGVSLTVRSGETLGLVGESGCGKSVTALSVLRLLPDPPAAYDGGEVIWKGRDLLALPAGELRRVRGNEIACVFQEPMTSLNPVFPIGSQVAEVARLHHGLSRHEARQEAVEALRRVGIPSPSQRARDYPHQLSGGMCQRVMIAMALAGRPEILIADEPTTALDVTIQAQILDLLRRLQAEEGLGVLLITHDLGVVAETAGEVAVMYAGRVVEHAPVAALFDAPRHPYTAGLFRSLPALGARRSRLAAIPGSVPSLLDLPPGCRFSPRCHRADARCAEEPPVEAAGEGHTFACFHPEPQ